MNDPEVIMSEAPANTDLMAHVKALEAAGIAIGLVLRVPAPLKSIADQAIRSAVFSLTRVSRQSRRRSRISLSVPG
jgi:hypothetical protein